MVFSILILLDPFSDVRQFAIRVLHMFFGRRIRQSETCYLHDDIRGHEGLSEEDDRVPAMTPSLNALVTDADVNHFLEELGSAPTEREVVERHDRDSKGLEDSTDVYSTEEEVVSGVRSGRLETGASRSLQSRRVGSENGENDSTEETASAASEDTAAANAAGWSVLARGDTGNGTVFRMLKRDGPAPGTNVNGKRGLTQFRLEMVMEGVSAKQLARVQMNDVIRGEWDTSLLHADHLAKTNAETYTVSTDIHQITDSEDNDDVGEGSELAFWRMKFPMPLAPRDYLFVRRRWRSEDGAYFGVTKDATGSQDGDAFLAANGIGRGSGYRVRRIFSGQRIRDVSSSASCEFSQLRGVEASPANSTTSVSGAVQTGSSKKHGAAELVSVYHEDSGVPAAVICLGACKGLMPYMRNLEQAARSRRFENGNVAQRRRDNQKFQNMNRHSRIRRRLFGGKDGKGEHTRRLGSFWPLRRFSLSRGDANSRWFPRGGKESAGENSVLRVRGKRAYLRSKISQLKRTIIHRTVRRQPQRHDHVHAMGRRRRLMVRAAGLVAVMSRITRNR